MKNRFITKLVEILPEGRNRRLATGILSGILIKTVTFTVTIITVPMTLNYLGSEQYGVWVTMISLLAWFSMVDFGLVNGLTPALSSALGQDRSDLAQQYVAAAFWGLVVIVTLSLVFFSLLWFWVDWGAVFNVESPAFTRQISIAVALAVGIFFLNMLFSISKPIFFGHQEGSTANLWQLFVSVAGVIGLYLVTQTQGGLPYLVIGFSGVQMLVMMVSAFWLFTISKPHLHPFVRPERENMKHVFSLGGFFFFNQLATLALYQKDNILITQILGPAQVVPYSVTWQMFLYLNFITLLVVPYLSPGYGEAYARGDIAWIRKAFYRHMLIAIVVVLPVAFAMVLFHKQILTLWLGKDVVLPAVDVVIWIAIFSIVMSIMGPIIALLNGIGRLRVFTIVYGIATVIGLVLSVILIRKIGISGGAMASAMTVALLVLLPSLREVFIVLRPPEFTHSGT